jgi:hypothetical protein
VSEHFQVVPLIEELRIEAALVPNRRGELYRLAAERIEALQEALDCQIKYCSNGTIHATAAKCRNEESRS